MFIIQLNKEVIVVKTFAIFRGANNVDKLCPRDELNIFCKY